MLAIPLTIVAASISAAVYMAFGWRPSGAKASQALLLRDAAFKPVTHSWI